MSALGGYRSDLFFTPIDVNESRPTGTIGRQRWSSTVGVVLDSVEIQGFRSLREVELSLGSVNLLIGPNGAGKSNLIGAFSMLGAMVRGDTSTYVARAGGARALIHRGEQPSDSISFELAFHQSEPHLVNSYRAILEPANDDAMFFANESVSFRDSQRYKDPYEVNLGRGHRESALGDGWLDPVPRWVRDTMTDWVPFHFHDTSRTSPMKAKGRVDDNDRLRPDGGNLAAVLLQLRESDPAKYEQIREMVRQVAPFFDDFNLKPDRRNDETIQLEWKQRNTPGYFNASDLSDGTLRFIALATLLRHPRSPSLVLIDEPELGLHPYAIRQLSELITTCDSQVLVSTQSVTLLDQLPLEYVVVANNLDGETTFARPDPEFLDAWLNEYSVGELWQKNLLGGRPVQR